MEQFVRVKEVHDNGTATVILIRESACSGDCHKCSGCGAAKETMVFTAENRIGARRGDLVKVESATGPVLKAAAVLYMIPLILFFLGYYLGTLIGWPPALVACLGFVLSVVIVVKYDRSLKQEDFSYAITAYAGDALLQSMRKEEHNHG